MATGSVPAFRPLHFELNRSLLAGRGAVAIEVTSEAPRAVADALASRSATFPAGDFILGSAQVRAEAGDDIIFSRQGTPATVNFTGSAGVHTGLALLADPDARLQELGFEQAEQLGLSFDPEAGVRYLMLSWGYDLAGAAKGSVALGAVGKATFGVEAAREATYALLRRIPDTAKALPTLAETVKNWRMPSQVKTADDLLEDTWIISEVDGSVAVKLGAQFGYDFNWVREFQAAGLRGEFGLKVQLGANIVLGFNASGNYAVVVQRSKEQPDALRLRLFKLGKKGWNFAFNAGAKVELKTTGLPNKADDFIEAILGVHGSQIVKDIQTIEEWTDPDNPIGELVADLGVDYGFDLLDQTTGVNARKELDRAQNLLQDSLAKWNALPNETATLVWKTLRETLGKSAADTAKAEKAVKEVRDFTNAIVAADRKSLGALITSKLGRADFFRTPAGMWLETLAGRSLLSLLDRAPELKDAAAKTAAILDEGAVENVLRRVQRFVEERLNLDKVINLASQADFDNLDRWLKAKLANFIDEKIEDLNLTKALEIRKAIHVVLGKRQEFYEKAIAALNRQYQFNFAAAFQQTTTRTALIDVEFAFNGNSAEVSALLQAAIDGDFDRVLVDQVDGVTLNQATLTHGVRRQASVEISLPHFNRQTTHVNQVLAQVSAVEDNGRLLLYDLQAEDRVTTRNQRSSELAIAASLPVKAKEQIRVWNPTAGSITYGFEQARRKMKGEDLEFQLRPLLSKYFPDSFGNGKGTVREWVRDLDTQIEAIDNNGTDQFGNTLLSMELRYPITALAGWMQAPRQENTSEYRALSRAIQRSLRELIPLYYFEDPEHYRPLVGAAPLLVYQNLPVSARIRLNGNQLTLDSGDGILWDWRDSEKLAAMAGHSSSRKGLEEERVRIERLLDDMGMDSAAREYRGLSADALIALSLRDQALNNLESLLFVEEDVIRGAVDAGQKLAKFREEAPDKPGDAIRAFGDFGSKLTASFNKRISGIYGGGALRALGPMVLVQASRALLTVNEGNAPKPDALLTLSVLKKEIPFPPEGFPDNPLPGADDLVTEQRLVTVGSPS